MPNNNRWKEVSETSILRESSLAKSHLDKFTGKTLPNSESTPSPVSPSEVWAEVESNLCELLLKFHYHVRHHTACLFEIVVVKSQRELDVWIVEEDSHEKIENLRGDQKSKGDKC